jgi:hypothetical protein
MTSDTPQTRRPASGGTALLLIVSFATIITVAAEAAFVRWGTWALLPVMLLAIVVIAAVVVTAVGRLIDDGEIVAAPRAAEAVDAEPEATPVPAMRHLPVLGR